MTCPPRYATPRDPARETLGPSVAAVAEKLGHPLMPWQRLVVDVALEVDPSTGRLAYRDVIVTVPRQQGKTSLLLTLRVHRAVHPHWGGPQSILWTAQSRLAARTKWTDTQLPLLQRSPFSALFKPRFSTGQEGLRWGNGSRDMITASGESSGHGETLDLGVIDEAWAQVDLRLEQAMRPAMLTRPQPQLWVVSTAGNADSTYLHAKVETGRELAERGCRAGMAYFEWSADPAADPGEPDTWRSCLPALGVTVTEEAVAADHAAMRADEFTRSHLNLWTPTRAEPIFEWGTWESLSKKAIPA